MTQCNSHRRTVLKQAISASTLALMASSGLLAPQRVFAFWPKDAFTAEAIEDALLALLGEAEIAASTQLDFKIGMPPSYAVNGASVPVQIQSQLAQVERIALLVERNPFPLAMSLDVTPEFQLPFKTMIKMREDSNVIAVIRANGKLYRTSRFVKVDIGGCS